MDFDVIVIGAGPGGYPAVQRKSVPSNRGAFAF